LLAYLLVFSGYVPRSPFKFGKTYREECDVCLAEFLAGQSALQQRQRDMRSIIVGQTDARTDGQARDMRSMTRSAPGLSSSTGAAGSDLDPRVRDHLNSFRDRSFHSSTARQYNALLNCVPYASRSVN